MRVSGALRVLIVHFNTPEMTSRLVEELPAKTAGGREVFVHLFDNGSTRANLGLLRESVASLQNLTLHASAENLGFGAGINALASSDHIGDSDIIWILNPDTRVPPGCLDFLEAELDAGYFAVISPLIFGGDDGENTWIWYCGGNLNTRAAAVEHSHQGDRVDQAPRKPFETSYITGTAPIMRVTTFRAVGGFPRDYFLYWEDAYFSWKARELGFRLGVVPSATLWHAIGASSGRIESATYFYWSTRNRFAFARDAGVPLRRLFLGRGGLETLRPIARALLVGGEGRISKTKAAIGGTISGLARTQGSARKTRS